MTGNLANGNLMHDSANYKTAEFCLLVPSLLKKRKNSTEVLLVNIIQHLTTYYGN